VAGRLVQSGNEVLIEEGAGLAASFDDRAYAAAGARVIAGRAALHDEADVVLKVQNPALEEIEGFRAGSALVSQLQPHNRLAIVVQMAARNITAFSMDAVPRITKAQGMDALSSMSTLAGYKAVLLAAAAHGRIFPMLTTAAGTLAPAKGFILGAGVAGLQAIATARRLGAIVSAFDIRPATREQVQSLGATFIEAALAGERTESGSGYARELSQEGQNQALAAVAGHIPGADFVIATALIPGKPAPILITEDMVRSMKPGSVIVDLAAETGGNCVLTEAGKEVVRHGVTILGPVNLAATVPMHASQMYARNIAAFLAHVSRNGALHVDLADPITGAMCLTHGGRVVHRPTLELLGGGETPGGSVPEAPVADQPASLAAGAPAPGG
jgi:NAD(P) transhydrogenase subunit alpha